MKSYNKFIAIIIAIVIALFAVVNLIPIVIKKEASIVKVEISRVVREITESDKIPNVNKYSTILGVYEKGAQEDFFKSENNYVIREIDNKLYRIEYFENTNSAKEMLYINIALSLFSLSILITFLYIRHNILKPYSRITTLPYELSKGNLTIPLKENKSRYFGKFLWGLDMLREKLEESKQAELELKKEKKTMLLSLSHDIKTPLSAIKLYSKALSSGIYKEPAKQLEVYNNINAKADEIEKLVAEIMRTETEDIIAFDVKNSEFYLSAVINYINTYYSDKLTNTDFSVAKYSDCILNGDCDRLIEVLQNIIENAIKYGDGISISIDFFDEEDCRIITVKNSGCTLEKSELAHIFDSFYRGSNIGSKKGNGLGLYICRQLTKAMGGDIFADIENNYMCVSVVCKKK
ncbi:MAG: HAMP domain-containing sensor histidine kinase [Acutalibacteraceae bacterium]|nr:HAMP domain-containing sensor histidine kinase [Acutalibacteraceae bacterium]